jgi:exportin-1
MEQNPNIDYLKQYTKIGLEFLIQLSNIEDDELVKICLDYWHFFTMDILKKTRAQIFDQNNR